jgi:hypothetical protein
MTLQVFNPELSGLEERTISEHNGAGGNVCLELAYTL